MLERSLALEKSITVARSARQTQDRAIDYALELWEEAFETVANVELPSLRRFVKELGIEGVQHAIESTERFWGTKKHWMKGSDWKLWKYFCGVCWKMIKGDEGEDE